MRIIYYLFIYMRKNRQRTDEGDSPISTLLAKPLHCSHYGFV